MTICQNPLTHSSNFSLQGVAQKLAPQIHQDFDRCLKHFANFSLSGVAQNVQPNPDQLFDGMENSADVPAVHENPVGSSATP